MNSAWVEGITAYMAGLTEARKDTSFLIKTPSKWALSLVLAEQDFMASWRPMTPSIHAWSYKVLEWSSEKS